MIARDQPTIFPDTVVVRVSSVSDGTMSLMSSPDDEDAVWANRRSFIVKAGGAVDNSALVYVTYEEGRDFQTYRNADIVARELKTRDEDIADGLVTGKSGKGLFLPLADCCGLVLYDAKTHALMLSHLGRHSVEVHGARKSVEFMQTTYGSDPHDISAWLSPAVGSESYPVTSRGHRGIKDLIRDDLVLAGVNPENIEVSPVDTAARAEYFSHSEFKKGNRSFDGRFAVYAYLR